MAEALTLTYGYTAKDLSAVLTYVQRLSPAIIARAYYDGDKDKFAATPWLWSGTFGPCLMVW